ncbi:MAG: DNA translocase FtsK [Tenuifilaceae bacterium]|jgi:S-DNA-T family DNA segregation ATPase FtsK/SpoIIIE|nr:DNA translocase FtsK [Tenuifilaceae bacterium]
MAKKNGNDTPGKGEAIPKKSFFRDERVQFTVGFFTILFAVYLVIAFVSYLFKWQADQSFEWQSIFSSATVRVDNWAGKVGASFAAQFLNRWFGIASFIVPFLIGVVGFWMLKLRVLPLRKTLFRGIVGMIILSLIFGFLFEQAGGFLGSGLGGAHGLFVTQWVNAFVGKTGTAFLLLVITVSYLFFVSDKFVVFSKRVGKEIIHYIKSFNTKSTVPPAKDPVIEPPQKAKEQPIAKVDDSFDDEDDIVFGSNGFGDDEISTDEFPADEVIPDDIFIPTSQPIVESTTLQTENVEIEVKRITEEEGEINPEMEVDFYDPTLELSSYQRPPLELLEDHKNRQAPVSDEELLNNKNKIVETLGNYNIQISRILATVGPTVTLYEIVPAPGVRISKIKNLEDDIALSLAALGIRIIAPIPGRGTIGIEVPNQRPEVVSMYSILRSAKFQESKYDLAIALGKTISNETFVVDLTKMPHLLVAGATGQGKSVGLNAIITSLLYKKHPAQLKFVLVDPKKVELTLYNKLERHFLAKLPDSNEAIITDTQKVINTLNSLCIEMDSRYDLLKAAHVRTIKEYNEKFVARRLNPNKGHKYLPYIVVIIDEFADLIMTAGREIESPIQRLAQLARAIGIHLIIATQRPTTNIITGVIKANFPARIAFRVTSMIDSRTILDSPGANQLIGKGDMLLSTGNEMVRVQCAFVDTPEVERVTDFIGNQRGYATAFMLPEYTGDTADEALDVDLSKRDDLFEDAARVIVANQQGSTSLIQRKFSIGYNRAGRIIDQLEAAGIVGPFEGSKARQVLIQDELSLEHIFKGLNDSKINSIN